MTAIHQNVSLPKPTLPISKAIIGQMRYAALLRYSCAFHWQKWWVEHIIGAAAVTPQKLNDK